MTVAERAHQLFDGLEEISEHLPETVERRVNYFIYLVETDRELTDPEMAALYSIWAEFVESEEDDL